MDTEVKILFVGANPEAIEYIDVEADFHKIQDAKDWALTKGIRFAVERAEANKEKVNQELARFNPHILHFSAHGRKPQAGLPYAIALHSLLDRSEVDYFESQQILDLLAQHAAIDHHPLQMVVFNCCHSFQLAEQVTEFIPSAIGTTAQIHDQTAADFSLQFYRFLASVDVAAAYERSLLSDKQREVPAEKRPLLYSSESLPASQIEFYNIAAPTSGAVPENLPIKLGELCDERRKEYDDSIQTAVAASNCSLIELEVERLQGDTPLQFQLATGERVQSLRRELHRKLLTGRTPVAQDLRRIYPPDLAGQPIYVERRIDEHFANYMKQFDKNVFVFANRSGAGKSTFLAKTAYELSKQGNFVFFLTGSQLAVNAGHDVLNKTMSGSDYRPEEGVLTRAAREFLYDNRSMEFEVSKLVSYSQSQVDQKEIFFFIDALDRAPAVSAEQLANSVRTIVTQLSPQGQQSSIRIVISCRSEVWKSKNLADLFVNEDGALHRQTYFSPQLIRSVRLEVGSANLEAAASNSRESGVDEVAEGWYSSRTCARAFEKYQNYYRVKFNDNEDNRPLDASTSLSEEARRFLESNRELLQEPLSMRIFFETYQNRKVETNALKKWGLLTHYVHEKRKDIRNKLSTHYEQFGPDSSYGKQINALITSAILFLSIEVLCTGANTISRRDTTSALRHWLSLLVDNKKSFRLLDDVCPSELSSETSREFRSWLKTYFDDFSTFVEHLLEAGLSVDLLSTDGDQLRFTLDLYFEFCLGRAIGNVILNRGSQPSTVLAAALDRPSKKTVDDKTPTLGLPAERNDVSAQFLENSIKFAILHIEASSLDQKQWDSLAFCVDCLAYLTTRSFQFQTLASEAICEMSVFQSAESDCQAPSSVTRRLIDDTVDRCLIEISNKGDFVYRFALRQAIVALKKNHGSHVDELLSDWLEVLPCGATQDASDRSSTAEMLRFVAMIDALGEGKQRSDFNRIIECLQLQNDYDDSEISFWVRRFGTVSLIQFIRRQRKGDASELPTNEAYWQKSYDRAAELIKSMIAEERSELEQAMLSEQYVYFLFHTGRVDFAPLLSWIDKSATNPWQTYSILFGIINAHNLHVHETHRQRELTAGRLSWRSEFDKLIQSIAERVSSLLDRSEHFHQLIAKRLLDGLRIIESHPQNRLEQCDLFPNDPFEFEKDCDLSLVQVLFSPEFFSTYFDSHHECRERIYCLLQMLGMLNSQDAELANLFQFVEPDRLESEFLNNSDPNFGPPVHEDSYVHQVEWLSKQLELPGETREEAKQLQVKIRPGSWGAALRSAGATKRAVDAAFSNNQRVGISLNRPPGHLATNQICIFNNIALAVRYAQSQLEILGRPPRITVVDFDAHHGSHLQNTFFGDANVAYLSVHQDNVYPSNGFTWQIGQEYTYKQVSHYGVGKTLNFPIPENATIDFATQFSNTELSEHLELHKPEAIFVALGVDADFRDPFAQLKLEPKCFFQYGKLLNRWCKENESARHHGQPTPIIVAFEGGFALTNGGSSECFEGFLRGLLISGESPSKFDHIVPDYPPPTKSAAPVRSIIANVERRMPRRSPLNIHGDVRSILNSNVTIEKLAHFKYSDKRIFGIGAAGDFDNDTAGLAGLGELLTIDGLAYVQCPITKQVVTLKQFQSPFCISWSGQPELWLRIRTWESISLTRLLKELDRALDMPAATYGVIGAVRIESGSDITEKRIARPPTPTSLTAINQELGIQSDSILHPLLIEEFFDIGIPDAQQLDPTIWITGVCSREGFQFPNDQLSESYSSRCFYKSALNPHSDMARRQSHIHFAMFEDSQLNNLWSQSPIHSRSSTDLTMDFGKTVRLVSHLEDATVAEAYIGVKRLRTPN